MSPLSKSVERAGLSGLRRKRHPFRITPGDFFSDGELVRAEFDKVINGRDPRRIVIVPSVSYGLANVTKNIPLSPSDNIIVAGEQFPSNFYPWQQLSQDTGAKVKTVAAPDTLVDRGLRWNQHFLESIDQNTRVVALGNVHWADGTLFDLPKIRKRTMEVGALLIIDGTQSVGALPFDVQEIQPDALVCAGYKWLMGPFSFGLAYYGKHFDQGKPLEENWINRLDSENFQGLVNYKNEYQPGSLRYEVGEHSNFVLLPMMLEALKQINRWTPEKIQAYCKKITQGPIEQLRNAGFWIEGETFRGYHLFGIRLPKHIDLDSLKQKLLRNKMYVSFRGNAIRVSPNVYNREEEMERLVKVLTS